MKKNVFAPRQRTFGGAAPKTNPQKQQSVQKNGSVFAKKVIQVISKSGKGKIFSYKDVASRAGNPKAARAVGNILNRRYKLCREQGKETLPCHRVIRSDGKIGGYAGGENEKRRLLKREGISFARFPSGNSQKT